MNPTKSINEIAQEELDRLKPQMTVHEWFSLQEVIKAALLRAALRGRRE